MRFTGQVVLSVVDLRSEARPVHNNTPQQFVTVVKMECDLRLRYLGAARSFSWQLRRSTRPPATACLD